MKNRPFCSGRSLPATCLGFALSGNLARHFHSRVKDCLYWTFDFPCNWQVWIYSTTKCSCFLLIIRLCVNCFRVLLVECVTPFKTVSFVANNLTSHKWTVGFLNFPVVSSFIDKMHSCPLLSMTTWTKWFLWYDLLTWVWRTRSIAQHFIVLGWWSTGKHFHKIDVTQIPNIIPRILNNHPC